jgi:hypothetical protein
MKVAFSNPLSNSSDGLLQGLVPIRDRKCLVLKEASNGIYFVDTTKVYKDQSYHVM